MEMIIGGRLLMWSPVDLNVRRYSAPDLKHIIIVVCLSTTKHEGLSVIPR